MAATIQSSRPTGAPLAKQKPVARPTTGGAASSVASKRPSSASPTSTSSTNPSTAAPLLQVRARKSYGRGVQRDGKTGRVNLLSAGDQPLVSCTIEVVASTTAMPLSRLTPVDVEKQFLTVDVYNGLENAVAQTIADADTLRHQGTNAAVGASAATPSDSSNGDSKSPAPVTSQETVDATAETARFNAIVSLLQSSATDNSMLPSIYEAFRWSPVKISIQLHYAPILKTLVEQNRITLPVDEWVSRCACSRSASGDLLYVDSQTSPVTGGADQTLLVIQVNVTSLTVAKTVLNSNALPDLSVANLTRSPSLPVSALSPCDVSTTVLDPTIWATYTMSVSDVSCPSSFVVVDFNKFLDLIYRRRNDAVIKFPALSSLRFKFGFQIKHYCYRDRLDVSGSVGTSSNGGSSVQNRVSTLVKCVTNLVASHDGFRAANDDFEVPDGPEIMYLDSLNSTTTVSSSPSATTTRPLYHPGTEITITVHTVTYSDVLVSSSSSATNSSAVNGTSRVYVPWSLRFPTHQSRDIKLMQLHRHLQTVAKFVTVVPSSSSLGAANEDAGDDDDDVTSATSAAATTATAASSVTASAPAESQKRRWRLFGRKKSEKKKATATSTVSALAGSETLTSPSTTDVSGGEPSPLPAPTSTIVVRPTIVYHPSIFACAFKTGKLDASVDPLYGNIDPVNFFDTLSQWLTKSLQEDADISPSSVIVMQPKYRVHDGITGGERIRFLVGTTLCVELEFNTWTANHVFAQVTSLPEGFAFATATMPPTPASPLVAASSLKSRAGLQMTASPLQLTTTPMKLTTTPMQLMMRGGVSGGDGQVDGAPNSVKYNRYTLVHIVGAVNDILTQLLTVVTPPTAARSVANYGGGESAGKLLVDRLKEIAAFYAPLNQGNNRGRLIWLISYDASATDASGSSTTRDQFAVLMDLFNSALAPFTVQFVPIENNNNNKGTGTAATAVVDTVGDDETDMSLAAITTAIGATTTTSFICDLIGEGVCDNSDEPEDWSSLGHLDLKFQIPPTLSSSTSPAITSVPLTPYYEQRLRRFIRQTLAARQPDNTESSLQHHCVYQIDTVSYVNNNSIASSGGGTSADISAATMTTRGGVFANKRMRPTKPVLPAPRDPVGTVAQMNKAAFNQVNAIIQDEIKQATVRGKRILVYPNGESIGQLDKIIHNDLPFVNDPNLIPSSSTLYIRCTPTTVVSQQFQAIKTTVTALSTPIDTSVSVGQASAMASTPPSEVMTRIVKQGNFQFARRSWSYAKPIVALWIHRIFSSGKLARVNLEYAVPSTTAISQTLLLSSSVDLDSGTSSNAGTDTKRVEAKTSSLPTLLPSSTLAVSALAQEKADNDLRDWIQDIRRDVIPSGVELVCEPQSISLDSLSASDEARLFASDLVLMNLTIN